MRSPRSEAAGGAPAARLFVALDPPAGARAAIAALRDEVVGEGEALRPVPDAALHVTLVFLGRTNEAAIAEVAALTRRAAEGARAPRLRPGGLVRVPSRRPRLLALDLDDDGARAGALRDALAAALAGAGLHEPEARPFWAHVTLARVRSGRRLPRPAASAAGRPAAEACGLRPFEAGRLTLYRSHLSPHGARYEPLASVALPA